MGAVTAFTQRAADKASLPSTCRLNERPWRLSKLPLGRRLRGPRRRLTSPTRSRCVRLGRAPIHLWIGRAHATVPCLASGTNYVRIVSDVQEARTKEVEEWIATETAALKQARARVEADERR